MLLGFRSLSLCINSEWEIESFLDYRSIKKRGDGWEIRSRRKAAEPSLTGKSWLLPVGWRCLLCYWWARALSSRLEPKGSRWKGSTGTCHMGGEVETSGVLQVTALIETNMWRDCLLVQRFLSAKCSQALWWLSPGADTGHPVFEECFGFIKPVGKARSEPYPGCGGGILC